MTTHLLSHVWQANENCSHRLSIFGQMCLHKLPLKSFSWRNLSWPASVFTTTSWSREHSHSRCRIKDEMRLDIHFKKKKKLVCPKSLPYMMLLYCYIAYCTCKRHTCFSLTVQSMHSTTMHRQTWTTSKDMDTAKVKKPPKNPYLITDTGQCDVLQVSCATLLSTFGHYLFWCASSPFMLLTIN